MPRGSDPFSHPQDRRQVQAGNEKAQALTQVPPSLRDAQQVTALSLSFLPLQKRGNKKQLQSKTAVRHREKKLLAPGSGTSSLLQLRDAQGNRKG